ncbi:MAG: FecR domain-containing protein, partial [Pseudomonadota bacterium]
MTVDDKKRRARILEQAHQWHLTLGEAGATEADHQAFTAWLEEDPQHGDLYDFAVTMHHAIGLLHTDDLDERMLQASWRERIVQARRAIGQAFFGWGAGLAALGGAMATAAYMFVFVSTDSQTPIIEQRPIAISHQTANGVIQQIDLDDGSIATLGAASQIDVFFSDAERRVVLITGTAFFDVARDETRSFVVEAGDMTATALGTEFDVRWVADVVRLAVAEGRVEVRYPLVQDEETLNQLSRRVLQVGQQVTAAPLSGLEDTRPISINAIGAWRDSRLMYDGVSLQELAADVSRYVDVPVKIDPTSETMGEIRVRGSFRSDDMEGMLLTRSTGSTLKRPQTSPRNSIWR